MSDPNNVEIIAQFHRLYYGESTSGSRQLGLHAQTYYHGLETHKCPLDLWIFQEIVVEVRPRLIIELGTYQGGSTLFLAHQLDALGIGSILSIDNRELPRAMHPRIRYLLGDTQDTGVLGVVREVAEAADGPVIVIHDADHHFEAVLADFHQYARFVTPGSYLICEDTNVNGHPVMAEWGPGPLEAVDAFLKENADFQRDHSREKFLLTYNPGGYLRRLA